MPAAGDGWNKKYGGEELGRKKQAEKGCGGGGTRQRGGNTGRGYQCIAKRPLPDLGPAGPCPCHWGGPG